MCLNFGTQKNIKFSVWNKWKIYYFRWPNIYAHYGVYIYIIYTDHLTELCLTSIQSNLLQALKITQDGNKHSAAFDLGWIFNILLQIT